MLAHYTRALRAESGHLIIEHFAIDVGTLEHQRPVSAAIGRAADHDPVDIAQDQTHPVHRMRIADIGLKLERRCRDAQRPPDLDARAAIVDDEFVDHVLTAAPAYDAAHLQPGPDQQKTGGNRSAGKAHA